MQSISKRILRFRRPGALLTMPRATFMTKTAYMRPMRRIIPAVGMSAATLYFMNSTRYASTFKSAFSYSTKMADAEVEYREIELTGHENLNDQEMMAFTVGSEEGDKILLAKHEGKVYALSNFCSHFGVPLAGSVLFDDKVICPAHNAAFSIIDGFPEHAPAKDGLQTFEIIERDGKQYVKLPSNFKDNKVPHMATRDKENKTRFVIIGGGPAGLSAAETLRQSDFTGEIIILSAEEVLAYDRTLLSKALAKGDASKWTLRSSDFMDKYGIDFRTNSRVKRLDTKNNEVYLANDTTLKYDKLLIATGGNARRPGFPGAELEGVYTLRKASDQETIKGHIDNAKKVVIIGSGFIGYECAANLVATYKDEKSVNVVDAISVPFEHVLGKDVGKALKTLAEDNGVKFNLSQKLKKIVGEAGKVTGVELEDGTVLDADLVILGTGVTPATSFIQDGIELAKDGSVKVDPYLRTSTSNVFAAGDMAEFPYYVTGERARVEHWNHATQQGEVAAYNMLDKDIPYDIIPFFWTRNYLKTLQYTGYARDFSEVHIDGSLEELKFVAYYIKGDKILAAAGLNRGADIHVIKEAMRVGIMPSASEIKDGSVTVGKDFDSNYIQILTMFCIF